jgi:phosphotransferase system  glucose/maltose/N-acetylglucosamine-specific IIC component
VFESQPPTIYVPQRHSVLHGPLTALLVLWAIALPALLLLLTAFGPIGWLVGAGVAILLAVPWLAGIIILWFLRHIT